MFRILLTIAIVVFVCVVTSINSRSYYRSNNVWFAAFMSTLFAGIFIGLVGNAIAADHDGNYDTTITEYELQPLGEDKYAILADEQYTFRTDDLMTAHMDYVSLGKGDEAVVLVSEYDNDDFWTLFGRSATYRLILPDGGLDY